MHAPYRKQSLTYGSFPPYFHNKFRFGMVSHGNQALIILQIPENSGILMSILELFPLSAWVPIIIWNFWKPTDITQLKYSTASSSLYTLLQCIYQNICCQFTYVLKYYQKIFWNDLKFWELIFVDCQLFESLYRWNFVDLLLCILNKDFVSLFVGDVYSKVRGNPRNIRK